MPAPRTCERRHRTVAFKSRNIGVEQFLVSPFCSEKSILLSASEYAILVTCQLSDTPDGLANRLTAEFGEERYGAWIREKLRRFIDIGLIVPVEELLNIPVGPSNSSIETSALAFVTAGRPSELRRCVQSYQENVQRFDRTPELVVMDDSKAEVDREANIRALTDFRSKLLVRYAGYREKVQYITELSGVGLDPAIASFAVLGDEHGFANTTGANRNCVLLDTLGETIVCVDDDTVCTLFAHPEFSEGLTFGCRQSPRDMWYYSPGEEPFPDLAPVDRDLLAAHESLIGKTVASVVSKTKPAQINVDGACNEILVTIPSSDEIIRVTMSGVKGKSTVKSGRWYLKSSGATRERLAQSEAGLKRAVAGRHVFGVSRNNAIAHLAPFASTAFGLVNRGLLPPFVPVGRSQDSAFGVLLSVLNPQELIGHVPLAVTHAPTDLRTYQDVPDYQIADMVCDLASSFARSYPSKAAQVLTDIGKNLVDLAGFSDNEFWSISVRESAFKKAATLRGFAGALGNFSDCAEFWKNEVSCYHEQWAHRLTEPDYFIPIEFKLAGSRDTVKAMTKAFIRQMGSLLQNWPDILDAATHLREKGIRVSRPLR
jgi:hypothetical protein